MRFLRNLFDYCRSVFATSRETPPAPATIDWYRVTFDEDAVSAEVSAPGHNPWTARVPWNSIDRVIYKTEEFGMSDGIYLFAADRDGSLAIPVDAVGGGALWNEILRRELFDAELAIEVAGTVEPRLFIWPPPDPSGRRGPSP